MKVRHKCHLEITWLCRRDSSESGGSLSAAYNAWSKINEIGSIINDNQSCRTGAVRIGDGRASAKEYDPSS
jgi:hypothetical protein